MFFLNKSKQCAICAEKKDLLKAEDGYICRKCMLKINKKNMDSNLGYSGILTVKECLEILSNDSVCVEQKNENLQPFPTKHNFYLIDFSSDEFRVFDFDRGNIIREKRFSIQDIFDFELKINESKILETEVNGGIKRAIAGGLLYGGVGAIIGSNTAKKVTKEVSKINDLSVIILLNNTNSPRVPLTFISHGIVHPQIKGDVHTLVDKLLDLLKVHKNNNFFYENKKISNVDEIRKYKELLDEGIISQEEFELKKKQILNI